MNALIKNNRINYGNSEKFSARLHRMRMHSLKMFIFFLQHLLIIGIYFAMKSSAIPFILLLASHPKYYVAHQYLTSRWINVNCMLSVHPVSFHILCMIFFLRTHNTSIMHQNFTIFSPFLCILARFLSSKLSVRICNHVKYYDSMQRMHQILLVILFYHFICFHHVYNESTLRKPSKWSDISLCRCE